MDDTTRSIIDGIIVQHDKPIKLAGGHTCTIFYDIFRLTPNELARLAAQAVGHLSNDAFDVALGIAYEGIIFAAAIAGGRQVAILQTDEKIFGPSIQGKQVVIVGDIVLTGKHLFRAQQLVEAQGGRVVGYACIIDRSNGAVGTDSCPMWSAYQTSMV